MSMFHVKQYKLSQVLFLFFLFLIPIQTRIIFNSDDAYIGSRFSYHLGIMLYLSDIILVAAIVAWLTEARPWNNIKLDTSFWLSLGIVGTCLFGLFHVERLNLGLYNVIKWVELLILLFYIKQSINVDSSYFRLGAFTLFFSALFQAVLGIYQFHVQHDLGLAWLGEYIAPIGTPGLATIDIAGEKLVRAYGTLPHPNLLGAFLILGLSIGFFLVSRGTTIKERLFVSCGTIILLIATFLTFSRLAWFGAALVCLAFIVLHINLKSYRNGLLIVSIAIVSCGTIMALYTGLLTARVGELTSNSTSVVLRESFNKIGLDLWKESPLFGVGPGNYIPATIAANPYLQDWQYQPAHNIFIYIAAELGLIGLLFLVALIGLAVRFTWNAKNEPWAYTVMVSLFVFVIISSFDHYFVTIQQGRLMFFTVLGLALVTHNSKTDVSSN